LLKVKWDLEEAIALYDLYRREGCTLNVPKKELGSVHIRRVM